MRISYLDLTNRIKANNGLVTVLSILDKAITCITVILYIFLLVYAFFQSKYDNGILLYRSILVPAVSFVVVSIFRRIISSPRPYEVYGFAPVLEKNTVGKSFPSRHVFSIFMIAMTYLQISVTMAVVISLMGIVLAAIRVLGGVHFVKDVVAGIAIAVIIGVICYGVLCGVFGMLMLPF